MDLTDLQQTDFTKGMSREEYEAIAHDFTGHTPEPWMAPHFTSPSPGCQCQYVLHENYAGSICEVDIGNSLPIGEGGNDAPPPTAEEEKHFRQVAAMADYHLVWGNDTHEEQLQHARNLMEWLSLPLTPVGQPANLAQ